MEDFQRVPLKVGESKTIEFTVNSDKLAIYDADMKYGVEPGDFEVMVGGSSRDADLLRIVFTVGNRMNKIYFLMASLIVSMGLSAANATPARQLIKRLADLQNRGIMVGHQDDPVYGTTWKWDSGRSDVQRRLWRLSCSDGF